MTDKKNKLIMVTCPTCTKCLVVKRMLELIPELVIEEVKAENGQAYPMLIDPQKDTRIVGYFKIRKYLKDNYQSNVSPN